MQIGCRSYWACHLHHLFGRHKVTKMKTEYKFITFFKMPKDDKRRKTDIWECWRYGVTKLGEVRWWGSWRQYTFQPSPNTVFSKDCMLDIIDFINQLMEARK